MEQIKQYIIEQKDVAGALAMFRKFANEHRQAITGDLLLRLAEVGDDYERMRDFMLQGYRDPQRDVLYRSLLRRLYGLACDWDLRMLCSKGMGAYSDAAHRTSTTMFDHDNIRSTLEEYVQNVAMMSLDAELSGVSEEKVAELYRTHVQNLNLLFEYLLIAPQWTKGDEAFYCELLLSPTIDSNDVRVLISALMLSAMTEPDYHKLRTLATIYEQSTDETIRQRALAGIAFSLPHDLEELFPEYAEIVGRLCDNPVTRKQLLEMQIQVFLCMNADRDRMIINRDIMPGIIRNQNLNITRFGIEEKENDPLQDILHPDAEDKAMEELETNIKKMFDMQKAGADIYFGGFSQMKRYSFFYTLCNWFTPFYIEHPGLSPVRKKLEDGAILKTLINDSPLCDSDKYSFALAIASVIDNLPSQIREVMSSGVGGAMPTSDLDMQSSTYQQRIYLQDLYRFFRLYNQSADFRSPFDYQHHPEKFFFANKLLKNPLLNEQVQTLERYLLKHDQMADLMSVLDLFADPSNADYQMLEGLLAMKCENYLDAQSRFERALELQPDNPKAMKALAQAAFYAGNYDVSEERYGQLLMQHPDDNGYKLNHAISQVYNGEVDEGLATLYEMHYNQENNRNVRRALAWALLMKGNLDQAEAHYRQLMDKPLAADYLNGGYCLWFKGQVKEAVQWFRNYISSVRKQKAKEIDGKISAKPADRLLREDFRNDASLLNQYKINDADQQIMIDIVTGEAS